MKKGSILILIITMALLSACNQSRKGQKMEQPNQGAFVFPKGDKAGNEYFSGSVWVQMLHSDEKKNFDTQVYNVTFDASARTFWHSHPGGQILLITNGSGYYQEKGKAARFLKPGDIVAIPADVVHWHGASPESQFVHIGMSTQVRLGPAKWFGSVTDQEYSQATTK